jgi:hypothetical protein
MYAAWIEGATDADIQAIQLAMDTSPSARASAATVAARNATHHAKKIVIDSPLSPEFGSSLAIENSGTKLSTGTDEKRHGGEGGIDSGLPGPRPTGDACASSKIAPGDFVEPVGSSTNPAP